MITQGPAIRHLNLADLVTYPAKTNVHFPIRGELFFSCTELNRRIISVTKSEIDFCAPSLHVPHITLQMGVVRSFESLEGVLLEVERLSRRIEAFALQTSEPYLKKPDQRWVFFDIDPQDRIKSIKRELESALAGYLEPLDWDVTEEPPHLTVGHIGPEGADEIKRVLESYHAITKSTATALEISFAGKKGTCLGSLRTFELCSPQTSPKAP